MSPVHDGPDEAGAGSRVLLLFANPLSAKVLRAHSEGPIRPSALYHEVGWSARTTIRTCVGNLQRAGALVQHQIGGSAYAVETELTVAGWEMLYVGGLVETWLTFGPDGAVAPDSSAAKVAVKALAGGWGSNIMQALAVRPRTLAELDNLIPGHSYHSLKRRLAAMRLSHQVEAVVGVGGRAAQPYAATDWLRRSLAPLSAAGRCELRHMGETTIAMTDAETETAMLLTMPLALLPAGARGTCTLGVQGIAATLPDAAKLAGATVGMEGGRVVSCVAQVDEGWSSWALGSTRTWLDVFIDGHLETPLRISASDPGLATDLVSGIHDGLFGDPPSPNPDVIDR